jgi:coenzyme Q-binding protein COQ10
VRSVRGNISVVEEHMNLGDIELLIMAKHVTKEPVLHEIFVIGGDAKGTIIKQQFIKISEGTKILVDIDLKLKGKMKLSSMIGKNKFAEDYMKILDDFAKIAEN